MEPGMLKTPDLRRRRYVIGGSDARIIIGDNEAALLRLWQEKRGQAEPVDLSGNLREPEPTVVSGQFGSGAHRHTATHSAPRPAVDGSHTGRQG
jgi:hypothetical protein